MKSLISIFFVIVVLGSFCTVCHAVPDLDFWLDMYDTELIPGDSLMLEFVTMNNDVEIPEAAFCLLLEVNGQFWCWPNWCSLNDQFDYQIRVIPENRTKYWIFNSGWPDVPPLGIDLYFWGAVLDVNLTKLLAPVDKVTWTY